MVVIFERSFLVLLEVFQRPRGPTSPRCEHVFLFLSLLAVCLKKERKKEKERIKNYIYFNAMWSRIIQSMHDVRFFL